MASAKGIRAGRAYVEVGSDQTSLEKGLHAAEARLKAFGASVARVGAVLSGLGASITAPLFGAAKSFADAGSELADASARTGATVETLSALGFAAQQTGTDLGTVEQAFSRMQKSLVKGSEENLQAEATFASLGLSVDALMRQSPDQQFEAVARAIGQIPNPTAKAAAAMSIFGKSGTQLLPMIDDMDALTSQAKALGLVMSSEDAASADALGDAMDTVAATLGRVVQVVGAALAPLLAELAQAIALNVKFVIDWVAENRAMIVTAFKVGAAIAAVGLAVTAVGGAIVGLGAVFGGLAAAVGTIGAALAAILSPIGLVVAGLAGLAAWFVTSTAAGGQALSWLGDRLGDLLATAKAAFGGIADALKSGDIALAGQILWAALKVEWLKGVSYLQSVWADWGTATIEVFRGVTYTIAGLMTDAWAGVKTSAANAWSFLSKGWSNLVGYLAKRLIEFGAGAMIAFKKVKAFVTGGDAEKAIAEITAGGEAAKTIVDQGTNEKTGKIEAERAASVAGIESDRAGASKALADMQQAEIDARRQAAQAGLKANADALKTAQDELTGLLGTAKTEAAAVVGAATAGKPTSQVPEFTPANLDAAVQQTKAKVDVAGAFSASALAGLGAGGTIGDQQLGEQKKTNDKLDKLNRTVKTKQAAFS